MTDEQRYLFDIHGYCHLQQAIVGDELAACQQAAADYINTPPEAPEVEIEPDLSLSIF